MAERVAGRTADLLLVFFLGAVLGLLTSFATFSGRLSSIEANQQAYMVRLDRMERKMDARP